MRFPVPVLIFFVIFSLNFKNTYAQSPPLHMNTGASADSAPTDEAIKGKAAGVSTGAGSGAAFPHAFAPLGVSGAHVIKPGKWLVAYTYGHMAMNGNLSGTDAIETAELLRRYPVVPVSMDVDMHMACLMRGITKNFSLMAMAPYSFKSMTMQMRNGTRFTTEAEGLGDVQLAGLLSLYRSAAQQLVFYGGASAPTGSINARDNTPTANNSKLGYTMQLGSGTIDFYPALTYMGKQEKFEWGGQISGVVRFGENYNDYRWGNRYRVTGWTGYHLLTSLIGSLRLDWQQWANIQGADPELDPRTTPGKDPKLRGGSRLDLLAGLSWYLEEGLFKGNRLFIEGGMPIYQDLDGPQGKTTWMLLAGWKLIF